MLRRILLVLPLALLACSGDNPQSSSGTPRAVARTLFMGTDPMVYTVRPAWSADGQTIVFSAGSSGASGSALIYAVSAAGGTPYVVSGPESYTPCFLGSGQAAWYQGWIDPDQDMHVMMGAVGAAAAPANAQVLRRWNGRDVGWQAGMAASPGEMSLCASGLHALVVWDAGAWCLSWSDGALSTRQVTETVRSGAVAPTGDRIVHATADGAIVVAAFDGTSRGQVASGSCPTWANDHVIGYLSATSNAYVVHDLDNGRTTSYAYTGNGQPPALSPSADAIAYRVWSADRSGIAVAELRD